ncbi:MAG: helical backbone metal receptor [Planctomycetota bacterium]
MVEPRIVSLVPSLTAAIDRLGRASVLVGRTVYCPGRAKSVGGPKNPDLEAIVDLAPDVVLAVREENRREDVLALRDAGLRVEVFEPRTVDDAPPLAAELGRLAGDAAAGDRMASSIASAIDRARRETPLPIPAVYFVWKEPWLAAGPDTWIASVLRTAGFVDVLAPGPDRYPEVAIEDLRGGPAELVLLSSEPFPFTREHAQELSEVLEGDPAARLCRGDLVGWYPDRLPEALVHLEEIRGTLRS